MDFADPDRLNVRILSRDDKPETRRDDRERRRLAHSQLAIPYHEVSVTQGHDCKSFVQTKAQGRTKAVTISVVPAIVSMTLNAHPI